MTSGIKLLWQSVSGLYLSEEHTVNLSEPVQNQLNGIVLHWQAYTPGSGVENYRHNYVFVPKTHAQNNPAEGISMILCDSDSLAVKYVYVKDTQITGHKYNSESNFSCQGMTLDNRIKVLTEVLGV